MATAAELLASKTAGDKTLVIDNDLRVIKIPSSITNLGVESDDEVLRLNFRMPRYLGKTDLSTFAVRINYLNAKGEGDVYSVSDLQIVGENLTFSWLVGPNATKYKGNTKFNVCMKIVDGEGYIQKEYNTTIATLPVLEGLETEEGLVELYSDILEQWKNQLFGIGDTEESNLAAKSAEEQENITQKGIEVLATIPEDYQTTYEMANNAYRTRANAIVSKEQGNIIRLSDSSNDPLRGLRVFGKTTQRTTTGAQLAWTNINIADDVYLGVTCSATEDDNVLLTGTSTDAMWNRLASANLVAGESYTLSAHSIVSISVWDVTANRSFTVKSAGSDSVTFVAPNTGNYSICIDNPASTYFPGILANIMLNSGETALPWEPYTGGVTSPCPDWPQDLRSVGDSGSVTSWIHNNNLANLKDAVFKKCSLIDKDTSSVRLNMTNGYYGEIYLYDLNDYLLNNQGKTYTFRVDANPSDAQLNIVIQGTRTINSGGTTSYQESNSAAGETMVSITPIGFSEITVVTLRIGRKPAVYSDNTTVFSGISFSRNYDSEFEPSAGLQTISVATVNNLRGIPVTTGGNYTDSDGQQWICDEIDFERGVYVQRVGLANLSNSYTEYIHSEKMGCGQLVVAPTPPKNPSIYSTLCNVAIRNATALESLDGQYYENPANIVLVGSANDTDVSIRAKYESLEVIYALATPIETELTAEELVAFGKLHSNYPNTTIFNDASATMEVKYNEDLKFYADEIMENAAETVITQYKIQTAVDAWLNAHYSHAEGVSF